MILTKHVMEKREKIVTAEKLQAFICLCHVLNRDNISSVSGDREKRERKGFNVDAKNWI